MKILLGIIGGVIVLGLLAYLLQSGDDTAVTDRYGNSTTTPRNSTTTPVQPATTTATSTSTTTPGATAISTVEIAVHGANYKFDPAAITVKQGQKVKLTFTSDGGLHDFVIDGAECFDCFGGAQTARLQSGKSETIEFTADKKGSFTYYCSVGKHRAMGMEGTLTVE